MQAGNILHSIVFYEIYFKKKFYDCDLVLIFFSFILLLHETFLFLSNSKGFFFFSLSLSLCI
jgi:hypothetical protein